MRNLFTILAVGLAMGLTACGNSGSTLGAFSQKLTPELITSVSTSTKPFSAALQVIGELGACEAVVEIASGVPSDLQSQENADGMITTCKNMIALGTAFLPVSAVLNEDGERLSKLESSCRDQNVRDAAAPGFKALIAESCT